VAVGLGLARLRRLAVGDGSAVGDAVAEGDAVGLALGDGTGLAVAVSTGGAVGCGVGGAVGRGVGGAVGGGVGAGAPWTVTVPVIEGWFAQWYAKVPAAANVTLLLAPAAIWPVSKAPVFDVAVWAIPSALRQVIVSPGAMVAGLGTNVKFWIVTVWLTPSAAPGTSARIATTTDRTPMRLFTGLR
jgi:hypothetical protein